MTTPPSPSSASRPLPAALSEKIDACIDARGAWAHAVRDTMDGAGTLADEDEAESAYYAARASLDAALRGMADDAALFAQLDLAYAAADFRDEQIPDRVVLKFALPISTRVSSDLRATLESAARAARPEASADA